MAAQPDSQKVGWLHSQTAKRLDGHTARQPRGWMAAAAGQLRTAGQPPGLMATQADCQKSEQEIAHEIEEDIEHGCQSQGIAHKIEENQKTWL